ncbi:hypothetical protein [Flexibacterium corallicola]|uniref:hypothetical protein n=1 Tax=Flexibacterium corallicola TaxID=3037259 RepID=UPI00286F36CA|nr:hypothetical protein [Pseudovibrio sp. M1P-2-3]
MPAHAGFSSAVQDLFSISQTMTNGIEATVTPDMLSSIASDINTISEAIAKAHMPFTMESTSGENIPTVVDDLASIAKVMANEPQAVTAQDFLSIAQDLDAVAGATFEFGSHYELEYDFAPTGQAFIQIAQNLIAATAGLSVDLPILGDNGVASPPFGLTFKIEGL